jgi:hypothetical protein
VVTGRHWLFVVVYDCKTKPTPLHNLKPPSVAAPCCRHHLPTIAHDLDIADTGLDSSILQIAIAYNSLATIK